MNIKFFSLTFLATFFAILSMDINYSAPASGSEILRCVARDNDGRSPWILSGFSGNGQQYRYKKFVFRNVEECRNIANSAISTRDGASVFCAARDSDGRAPWSFGFLSGGSSLLLKKAVFREIDQCNSALRRARSGQSFVLTCTSRDSDGRNPWSLATVDSSGDLKIHKDTTYRTFEDCLNNL